MTLMYRSVLGTALLVMAASCAPLGALRSGGRTWNPGDVAALRSYIETTNLDSGHFPWVYGLADGRLKRWDIEADGPIPVQLNGSALAEGAIRSIETRLGKVLFEPVEDGAIVRGILVTEGTAVGPAGVVTSGTCGNVSALPGTTSWPTGFYDETGRISTRLYVNLSSSKCTASLEIAIHEFGHALGMGPHFPDFGLMAAVGPAFWQVLANLYANDVGVAAEHLEVRLYDS